MLVLNLVDFRFREEKNDVILAYNVITNKMYFFTGNTKSYIHNILNNSNNSIELEEKYMNYLINNKILIKGDKNGI